MPSKGSPEERFPEIFHPTNIDRRGRKRTVEMKVIVIGMMRTGTMSMRTALEQLGYQGVYHMFEVVQNPSDADFWVEALRSKYFGEGRKLGRDDYDGILGDFQACIDLPSAALMPELIAAYPEAKVIVAMRDPDAWWKSVEQSVAKEHKKSHDTPEFIRNLLMKLDPFFLGKFGPFMTAMEHGIFGEKGFSDPEHCKRVYVAMHEEVRNMVPKENLLEFQLKQGWGPLCEFLGKDVPVTPFPHVNESAEFDERHKLIHKQIAIRILKRILPFIAIPTLVIAAGRHFSTSIASMASSLGLQHSKS